MNDSRKDECTRILDDLTSGRPRPADELLPLVYDELRALARAQVAREPGDATLQPTMLVHEAYLRLVGNADPEWNGRGHFFGAAARAMRRILVEQARRRSRRGEKVGLSVVEPGLDPRHADVLGVDEAVRRLEARDPRKGAIVELRLFAGCDAETTARLLGISKRTLEREWSFIKSWLQVELSRE